MKKLKKLFGGIDLTWKKLIIFAVITAVYTAIMAILPITNETSFRDIAIFFEWWILFGIIIIANSKSPLDSALKCLVFFLISQPLIYLIQVPFSSVGWQIFEYYKYWFIWTLACFPMGFIGYYIKKKNILSVIILIPMIVFLSFLGIDYVSAVINNFPHHLLSAIWCFLFIIIITLGLFDKLLHRLLCFVAMIITVGALMFYGIWRENLNFEVYRTIDLEEIPLTGEVNVTASACTDSCEVTVIHPDKDTYTVKLTGKIGGEYEFTLTDENNKDYDFEYKYSEESKSVELKLIK